jgi:hypothetical protein
VQNDRVDEPEPIHKIAASTPSIKDALNSLGKSRRDNLVNSESDLELVNLTDEEPDLDNTGITEEDVQLAWKMYIDTIPADGTRMINALRNQEPRFDGETGILTILFRNKALVSEFKENFKSSLVHYLTEKLSRGIEISEKVMETEDSPQTKYYTDLDKLKYMIEKNPAIAKLKQDFNLDFE